MGKPAARVGDMTAHGSPAAQAAMLAQKIAEGAEKIAEAGAKVTAASGTPAAPAAVADFNKTVIDAASEAAALMTSFMADLHTCPVVKLVVPDGAGVVINGSQTVLINGLAACRIGDIIQETTSVNSIAMGEMTVLVGG
jgi:uncharacterized Zn-binding protein involved in type VI secretion